MLFGSMQIVVSKYSPGDLELENYSSHEWVMRFLIAFLFCLNPSDESDGKRYLRNVKIALSFAVSFN
jgi:hypothetical protein